MDDSKTLLPLCLLAGLVVMIGLRGVAFLAHLVIPSLILGVIFFFVIKAALAFRR